MASRGKKKTTMAKLNREAKLRERRLDKQARKDTRRREAAEQPAEPVDAPTTDARPAS
jgi:hypothetical protein